MCTLVFFSNTMTAVYINESSESFIKGLHTFYQFWLFQISTQIMTNLTLHWLWCIKRTNWLWCIKRTNDVTNKRSSSKSYNKKKKWKKNPTTWLNLFGITECQNTNKLCYIMLSSTYSTYKFYFDRKFDNLFVLPWQRGLFY